MDKPESENQSERPMWQKPEVKSEEITTEYVVLGHCFQSPEEGCSTSPTVTG